ncbi:MAG: DUF4386 domain-containing protein [Rhodanobacter sp.]
MKRIVEGSPRPRARTIGVIYLLYFLTAIFSVLLTKGLVVFDDAAATANNILAHEPLYRSGFAIALIANAFYIALTALLYGLFEPVNRNMSLLAAFVSLIGCAVQISSSLLQLAPLVVLEHSQFLSGFTVEQLQAAALLFLKLHVQTSNIALVFFALYDLLIGYLIFRSAFLPRIFGVLLMLAGLGWLTYLWPPLATSLSSYVQPLGFLAEFLLMLWLLVRGVDVSR